MDDEYYDRQAHRGSIALGYVMCGWCGFFGAAGFFGLVALAQWVMG